MKKAIIWFVALILSLGVAPISPERANTWRVQPQLLAISKETPTAHLNIIVQKQATNHQVETLVTQLGGTVTLDLSIINGFAAQVPADALPTLATAAGVKWISFDAPMVKSGGPDGAVRTSNLRTVYNQAIRADQLWAQGYQGSSVGVAVLDSGLDLAAPDLSNHVSVLLGGADWYGHGTHVAGIIGGNGASARGKYIGVAPKAKLVDVSFASRDGQISASYLINAIQLILQYKNHYNIRVVNLSFNSTVAESYLTSPLSAAVEILWFNGIVVVTSAGNNGITPLNGGG
jgi:serine protease AprX